MVEGPKIRTLSVLKFHVLEPLFDVILVLNSPNLLYWHLHFTETSWVWAVWLNAFSTSFYDLKATCQNLLKYGYSHCTHYMPKKTNFSKFRGCWSDDFDQIKTSLVHNNTNSNNFFDFFSDCGRRDESFGDDRRSLS